MSTTNYDVIIIGAGSVGVPAAMALAGEKLSVLVLEELPSPGQGNNKKAIGGIRATHSDFGKIQVCLRSIEIFATWRDQHGDDLGWLSNGYSYPAYTAADEAKLKALLEIQLSFGLNIRWLSAEEYLELVPGLNPDGLRGATYSPGDGSASPLLSMNAFYFRSLALGAKYRFGERVIGIQQAGGRITGVVTDRETYGCRTVINAAGNTARAVAELAGLSFPVAPDNHEAAITEPVQRFFGPMIVDMRQGEDSLNYYFYQNNEGQVVFCITPYPSIWGIDNASTSVFFPQVARRMVSLYPRLANLKVRRSWRGQYPMTPDGFPIVGRACELPEFIQAIGMCGQGFMLGPGLGELLARMVTESMDEADREILKSFDPYRDFTGAEAFK